MIVAATATQGVWKDGFNYLPLILFALATAAAMATGIGAFWLAGTIDYRSNADR